MPRSDLKVIIVGAGIGGLMLAILLEEAGIQYEIFERARVLKPLGSCMSLSPVVMPLFKQIGLYDDFSKFSKPFDKITVYDEKKMKALGIVDFEDCLTRYGNYGRVFSRFDFHECLVKRIPRYKLHLGKRVLSTIQNNVGVMIRCHDGSTYHGDILVGADGANSSIRQNMYKCLAERKLLPPNDQKPLMYEAVCLVGTTWPLDPEQFPVLKDEFSHFDAFMKKENTSGVTLTTIPRNRIAWIAIEQYESSRIREEDAFKTSEWGPEAAEEMCERFRDHKTIYGECLGTFMDLTPKGYISKVMIEEKHFETWHYGRTVLVGDACHKVSPAGGQGAVQAILDAVTLANLLYDMPSYSMKYIGNTFTKYYDERGAQGKLAVVGSRQMYSVFNGKSALGGVMQKVILNLPKTINNVVQDRINFRRPQATFLPFIQDNGKVKPKQQSPSLKGIVTTPSMSTFSIATRDTF